MSHDRTIVEKTICVEVHNFDSFGVHYGPHKMQMHKRSGKDAVVMYKLVQTLKLTPKQNRLLLEFANSLLATAKDEGEKYARKCSVTGKGMNDGFCFGEGTDYAIDKKSALVLARKLGYKSLKGAYNDEAYYWTEWEMPAEAEYEVVNGILKQLRP